MEHTVVKFKRVDNGKYWIGGKVTEGKYGPQIGCKVTEELKAYLDSLTVGSWLNLNLDKPKDKPKSQASDSGEDINF